MEFLITLRILTGRFRRNAARAAPVFPIQMWNVFRRSHQEMPGTNKWYVNCNQPILAIVSTTIQTGTIYDTYQVLHSNLDLTLDFLERSEISLGALFWRAIFWGHFSGSIFPDTTNHNAPLCIDFNVDIKTTKSVSTTEKSTWPIFWISFHISMVWNILLILEAEKYALRMYFQKIPQLQIFYYLLQNWQRVKQERFLKQLKNVGAKMK